MSPGILPTFLLGNLLTLENRDTNPELLFVPCLAAMMQILGLSGDLRELTLFHSLHFIDVDDGYLKHKLGFDFWEEKKEEKKKSFVARTFSSHIT